MQEGIVFDLKRMSVDDGPGLRTVVFLKGCPLRCLWCHSPESINPNPELVFYESKCIGCGRCVGVCTNGVFQESETGRKLTHRARCRACGECARYCYAGALEIKGRRVGSEELLRQIEKDRIFYETSGGGVTFSGGEPLLQPRFLMDILKRCRAAGIHTAVDTCGYTDAETVKSVIPHVDLFLFDLKHMNDKRHREFTGVSNAPILRNLRLIAESGSDVIVSFPVVPAYNDSPENLDAAMRLLRELKIGKMRLLPYNKLAGSKYRWFGQSYPLEAVEPSGERWFENAVNMGRKIGIDVKVK